MLSLLLFFYSKTTVETLFVTIDCFFSGKKNKTIYDEGRMTVFE